MEDIPTKFSPRDLVVLGALGVAALALGPLLNGAVEDAINAGSSSDSGTGEPAKEERTNPACGCAKCGGRCPNEALIVLLSGTVGPCFDCAFNLNHAGVVGGP